MGWRSIKYLLCFVKKGDYVMRLRAIIILLTLCSCSSQSIGNERVTKAVEVIRSLCLVGTGYEIGIIGGGRKISIFRRGVEGEIRFSKKNLQGVVDVPDDKKTEELENIRRCTAPHIPAVLKMLTNESSETTPLGDAYRNKIKVLGEFVHQENLSVPYCPRDPRLSDSRIDLAKGWTLNIDCYQHIGPTDHDHEFFFKIDGPGHRGGLESYRGNNWTDWRRRTSIVYVGRESIEYAFSNWNDRRATFHYRIP